MKKFFILFLLAAFIIALIWKSFFSSTTETALPVAFEFEENLAVTFGSPVNFSFQTGEGVQQVDFICNDTVIKSWKNPTENLNYTFNLANRGVGTYPIRLVATLENGQTYADQRLMRVLSDIEPEIWIAKVIKTYPHQVASFTQGLEFNNGELYEGTGQKGASKIAKVDLKTGKHLQEMNIDATYFGEGITVLNGLIYQLTWTSGKCFVYDQQNLQLKSELLYSGEGWGLCNDGTQIIMSNGTERLVFRDPKTFQITKSIEVYTNQGPIPNLNELEFIDGKIYANVWMTNRIMVIDPQTGKVEAVIDGNEPYKIGQGGGDVLNGIAYNTLTKSLYLTGKYWPLLMEVQLKKPSDL